MYILVCSHGTWNLWNTCQGHKMSFIFFYNFCSRHFWSRTYGKFATKNEQKLLKNRMADIVQSALFISSMTDIVQSALFMSGMTDIVQSALFMSGLTKTVTSRQILANFPNIKFHETPCQTWKLIRASFHVKSVGVLRATTITAKLGLNKTTPDRYQEIYFVISCPS